MKLMRVIPAVSSMLMACAAGQATAAEAAQARPRLEVARMAYTDLRAGGPQTEGLRLLWKDKLAAGEQRWATEGPPGRPFPAFTLDHTFTGQGTPVTVSILFNLFDCELPGNGRGSALYARCPTRLVTQREGIVRVQMVDRVCHLYVPPLEKSGDGPDPLLNFTEASLEGQRTLRLRVYQGGKAVNGCDRSIALE